jgi:hypothetical protein
MCHDVRASGVLASIWRTTTVANESASCGNWSGHFALRGAASSPTR